jgi:hypothetical protein
MSPSEAAKKIGCSTHQVRWLIRNNKLKAKRVKTKHNQWGYEYEIDPHDVTEVKNNKPPQGRPRGTPRK